MCRSRSAAAVAVGLSWHESSYDNSSRSLMSVRCSIVANPLEQMVLLVVYKPQHQLLSRGCKAGCVSRMPDLSFGSSKLDGSSTPSRISSVACQT